MESHRSRLLNVWHQHQQSPPRRLQMPPLVNEALKVLKFNSINDAKKLLEAIEKIFGGNAATRKTKRNLLKQQYENFTAPRSEIRLHLKTFDRLHKLSQ
ncbi:hypothetical protein Tco_0175278 [Tanacetum coccineum]